MNNEYTESELTFRDMALLKIMETGKMIEELASKELANPRSYTHTFSEEFVSTFLRYILKLEKHFFIGSSRSSEFIPESWTKMITMKEIAEEFNIWIEYDRVIIQLPSLPHRYRGNQDLVAQLLAAKIHLCSQFPHWRTWHAEFIHLYPKKYKPIPKDVDNYNYKKVIDVIAYGLHTTDDAQHFDMAMTTVYSDDYEPGVYVQITPTTLEDRPLPSPIARKERR